MADVIFDQMLIRYQDKSGQQYAFYPITTWDCVVDAPSVGNVSELKTTDKSSIVNALNEIYESVNNTAEPTSTVLLHGVLYGDGITATFNIADVITDYIATVDETNTLIVSGRLPLTPGLDYTISDTMITFETDVIPEDGRNITVYVWRNVAAIKPTRLVKYNQAMQATTAGQTSFNITVSGYDKNSDYVMLTSGRTFLTEGLDYTISGRTLTLVEGVPLNRQLMLYVFRNELAAATQLPNNPTGLLFMATDGQVYRLDVTSEGLSYAKVTSV